MMKIDGKLAYQTEISREEWLRAKNNHRFILSHQNVRHEVFLALTVVGMKLIYHLSVDGVLAGGEELSTIERIQARIEQIEEHERRFFFTKRRLIKNIAAPVSAAVARVSIELILSHESLELRKEALFFLTVLASFWVIDLVQYRRDKKRQGDC